jgi:hypothetical protein
MKTRKGILIVVLCGFSVWIYPQSRKFRISLQSGWMEGKSMYNNFLPASGAEGDEGRNGGIDICYFVSDRFLIDVHFNSGKVQYWTYAIDRLSETHYESDLKSNGEFGINTIGLQAGYCLPVSQSANLTGMIGFSQFIQANNFPEVDYRPDNTMPNGFYRSVNYIDSNFFSASFPVKFDIEFSPFKQKRGMLRNIGIGYALGWYIEPDFGFFTAVYHGPQLSLSF